MLFKYFFQQSIFVLRTRHLKNIGFFFRKSLLQFAGMSIGKDTFVPRISVTWPHQVSIGNHCTFEKDISFKYDGIWTKGPTIFIDDYVFIGGSCEFNINYGITIGSYCNIASGCRFIDHDHGIRKGVPIGIQPSIKGKIVLEEDVWLGCNVVVLKGVRIGRGAIVGAGAVVTKSIPSEEIWGGVPARFISNRK